MLLICIWILFDTHDRLVIWFHLGDYVVQFFITIINHYSTYFLVKCYMTDIQNKVCTYIFDYLILPVILLFF